MESGELYRERGILGKVQTERVFPVHISKLTTDQTPEQAPYHGTIKFSLEESARCPPILGKLIGESLMLCLRDSFLEWIWTSNRLGSRYGAHRLLSLLPSSVRME